MNISKRERIIIILALLAALYAGWYYLFSGGAGDTAPSAAEDKPADEFLMEVAQDLALNSLTETEKAILEKAGRPWSPHPFIQTDASSSETASGASSKSSMVAPDIFSYTGYIEAGNRRLAIIGGTEYETGDRVANSLLTVRSISTGQVVLEGMEGRMYTAPLQDGSDRKAAPVSLQFE
jgi:hypothetical protein